MWKTGSEMPILDLVTCMRARIRHLSGHVRSGVPSRLPVVDGVDPSPNNSRRRLSCRRFVVDLRSPSR